MLNPTTIDIGLFFYKKFGGASSCCSRELWVIVLMTDDPCINKVDAGGATNTSISNMTHVTNIGIKFGDDSSSCF